MNCLRHLGLNRASVWLVVAGVALGCLSLQAGEKIEIGTAKSKLDPSKDSQLGKDVFKWKQKLDSDPFGIDLMSPSNPGGEAIDPRRAKQQKEKLKEQRNWIFSDQDSKEEDDKALQLWDDTPDSLLKKDDKEDWLSDDSKGTSNQRNSSNPRTTSNNHQGRQPGQSGNKTPMPPPAKGDLDDVVGSLRASTRPSDKADSQVGAHMSKELDFQKLLDTGPGTKGGADRSEASAIFKPGSSLGLSRDQQAMREEFKSFLNGSQSPSLSGTDPLNWRQDINRAAPAAMPKMMDSPLPRSGGGGLDAFSSPQGGRAGSGMEPVRRDWNYGGVSGFGTLPPANMAPAAPSQPAPPPSFDSMRARGLNSLGGH